jgi:hypothetical protein
MNQAKFHVGQRVAVLRDHDRVVNGIHAIEKITHNGTRIRVEGHPQWTFNRYGRTAGLSIVPATAEHEIALERSRLLNTIDRHLGTHVFHNERKELRKRIPMKALRDVAALLDLVCGREDPAEVSE